MSNCLSSLACHHHHTHAVLLKQQQETTPFIEPANQFWSYHSTGEGLLFTSLNIRGPPQVVTTNEEYLYLEIATSGLQNPHERLFFYDFVLILNSHVFLQFQPVLPEGVSPHFSDTKSDVHLPATQSGELDLCLRILPWMSHTGQQVFPHNDSRCLQQQIRVAVVCVGKSREKV